MKREFLQNFRVGDQPLTKEIIDAIMAENGRDIEETKKGFSDYETIKDQLAKAQETIKGFEGQDIEGVRKAAKDWEDKYNQAIADHKKAMDDRDLQKVQGHGLLGRYQTGRRWKLLLQRRGTEKVHRRKSESVYHPESRLIGGITFEAAKELGITDGTYPLAIPTREEVAVMVKRGMKSRK